MLCRPLCVMQQQRENPTVECTPLRVRAALEADEEHSAVVFGVPHRDGLVQLVLGAPVDLPMQDVHVPACV